MNYVFIEKGLVIDITYDEKYILDINLSKSKNKIYNCNNIKKVNNKNLSRTIEWLTSYFKGDPEEEKPIIKTDYYNKFNLSIFEIVDKIPYGRVTTYGEIAQFYSFKHSKKMSAQAVGNSLKSNKFLILIPCHRIIHTNGDIYGYKVGTDIKEMLLKSEGINIENGKISLKDYKVNL